MKFNLDRIEARLQDFIENGLQPFPHARQEKFLAQRMVHAMQTNLIEDPGGSPIAPNHYILTVHPKTLSLWQSSPDLLDRLAQVLYNAAQESGLIFLSPPVIRLSVDSALPPDGLKVDASTIRENGGGTTAVLAALPAREEPPQDSFPNNAFLIINGTETFSLRQVMINIGRRLDNDVIISDPRISRSHAQLRGIRGHYVLFDLNSSGGTFVNGQRITQQTLQPGDVISLSGVSLIYGEEAPPRDYDTSAMPPAPHLPGEPE